MNINEILDMFSDEEKAKVEKFYSNIVVAQGNMGNVAKVIETFVKEGLTFKKITDLRTLTIEVEEIVNKIDEYKNNELFDIVRKDVSILRFKVDTIINRLIDCGRVGKSYRDENGILYSFITNRDEWDRVYEGLNHEVLNKVDEKKEIRPITIDDIFSAEKLQSIYKALEVEDAQLDLEGFDRYSRLMNNLNATTEAMKKYELQVRNEEAAELIIRSLVSFRADNFFDEDILFAAIISKGYVPYYLYDEIKQMINEICALTKPEYDLESSVMGR